MHKYVIVLHMELMYLLSARRHLAIPQHHRVYVPQGNNRTSVHVSNLAYLCTTVLWCCAYLVYK